MEIVKKNLFSIVCGIVVVLAIIASYWPVGGYIASLQSETQTHAANYQTLQGLLTQQRNLPLTDPAQTTPKPLDVFPNKKVIAEGTAATTLVSTQSKQMLQLVEEMNQSANPLLVPDALPDPLTDTPRFRFRDRYKVVLSTDPQAGLASDPQSPANLQNDVLNGGTPPTVADITAAAAALGKNVYTPRIITVNGQPVNQQEVTAEYNAAVKKLPDEMRLKIARTKKMYVEPTAFTVSPNVTGMAAPAPTDIWFAQLGLWIQQNACAGLALANHDAKNVLDAPVKRLISLRAPGNYVLNSPASTTTPPAPTPVAGGDVIPVPKVYTISPTGRVSNPLYDVVHFQMVIDVEASRIPEILEALCKNRLVDVLGVDMSVIDNADLQSRGYIYGNVPVVRLSVQCEALFMRQWESKYMPDLVKKQLGIALPTATPVAAAQ